MVWFGGSWVLDLGSHSWSLSCNPLCDQYSILRHTTLQVGLSWVDLTTNSITVICATLLQLQISVYSADQIMAVAVCMAITARQRDREKDRDRQWEGGQGKAGQGRAGQDGVLRQHTSGETVPSPSASTHLRRHCCWSRAEHSWFIPPYKRLILKNV